jgi:hypothetical protein
LNSGKLDKAFGLVCTPENWWLQSLQLAPGVTIDPSYSQKLAKKEGNLGFVAQERPLTLPWLPATLWRALTLLRETSMGNGERAI